MKVWKYTLELDKINEIAVPGCGQFLDFQIQNDLPVIWILVDPEQKPASRLLKLIPTGEEFNPRNQTYRGTAQLGACVLHLFEFNFNTDGHFLVSNGR